jgi:cyclic dehypoxanthinyl futalosine synthase
MTDNGAEYGCSVEKWRRVHRTAHALGLSGAAEMTFGRGESLEQRMDFLEELRQLQEETGGFTAFIPQSAALARKLDDATAVEWLKVLAMSRLYLDNIAHVQSDLGAQGMKVLQLGLRFGGNDAGSAMPDAGGNSDPTPLDPMTEEELRRVIRDAGFRPVRRDTLYRTLFLN